MKRLPFLLFAACLTLLAAGQTSAQLSVGGTPPSFKTQAKASASISSMTMGAVDVDRLLLEDEQDAKEGIPFRFGYPFDVDYSIFNSGQWETLSDGSRLWRLRIEAPGAYSINLLFGDYNLPEGARLWVYSEDRSMVLGAFTSQNNKDHGKMATSPVKGDVTIVEYLVPADVAHPGQLTIERIVHAYRDIFFNKDADGFGSSGSCNNNVNCPEGAPWQDEKRSVAMITTSGGFRICTGALVNNVRQDMTPYFLTANHCLGGENSWVFIFNYESPSCANIDGPTWMSVSGSQLIATNEYSDFALLLLNEQPPDSYNVFYAGWNAVDAPASSAVGIHHPNGDIKKISFDYNPVTSSGYGGAGSSHWRIGAWDDGTTEPGSSGSPLFDPDHRIIGQLHGGTASCASLTPDYYGKFAKSWNYGEFSGTRLNLWLDPDNTGTTQLDGLDVSGVVVSADVNMGWTPLSVNFSATSKYAVDTWTWDFGDGDSAYTQSPTHIYDEPGSYDVKVEITSGGNTYFREHENYIFSLADTLIGDQNAAGPGDDVAVTVYARNNFPLSIIRIPVEYAGSVPMVIDSFSTAGCRTSYFTIKEYQHYDPFNRRVTIRLTSSTDDSQPELAPGAGPILKVYFSVGTSAESGDVTDVVFDGYLTYLPEFNGSEIQFAPAVVAGSVYVEGGCCVGMRGNVDNDAQDEINISDLVYMVEYQFGIPNGPAPECLEEADVDGSTELDVADTVYLVEYMFGIPSGPAPLNCP